MRESWRTVLAAIAAGLPMAATTQAFAEDMLSLDIEPQPILDALTQFSEQSGIKVTYLYRSAPTADIRKKTSTRLEGSYTSKEAIQRLLAGTRLGFEYVDNTTIRIIEPNSSSANRPDGLIRLAQVAEPRMQSMNTPARHQSEQQLGNANLEEIIVTAQKRAERLQDVPISISVLSGDTLDRSTAQGVSEALSAVPGVATTVYQQGGESLVTVRGVTASLAQFNGSSPVGYYIDAVPFGLVKTAVGPDSNAYDLKRVEVLRGPQGTLYGASALNGVVRILTNDTNPEKFQLKARTSLSSTEGGGKNYRGDMAINVPLIEEKLAARAVVGYESVSGWIDRPLLGKTDANDSRLRNMRVKVGARPTERLSIDLSAWLSRVDLDQLSLARGDGERSLAPIDEPAGTDYDVYGVTLGYDFSAFSVAATSSYLEYHNESDLHVGLTPLFTALDSEVTTQEILLNSLGGGTWRWSLGGVYREAEDRQLQTLPGILPAPIDLGDRSESFAVFGELTRIFLDGRFEVTAGLRYFEDDVTQTENVALDAQPGPLYRKASTFHNESPRLVLTWHPSDALTVYASYAEGFRSGFNQNAEVAAVAPEFPPVEADTLANYELGAKGSVGDDNRLTFDTAVYYVDWQDVQQSLAVPFGGTFITAPINGNSASGVGAEFALAIRPFEPLALGVNFSWNDLSMDTDVFSRNVLLFSKGDRLNYSPEYTAGVSADYTFVLGRGGYEGRFSTSANYTSERLVRTVIGGAQTIWSGDSLWFGNASIAVDSPNNWTAAIFVDNLNNEEGVPIRNIFNNPDRTVRVQPRTIGLQLEYRF